MFCYRLSVQVLPLLIPKKILSSDESFLVPSLNLKSQSFYSTSSWKTTQTAIACRGDDNAHHILWLNHTKCTWRIEINVRIHAQHLWLHHHLSSNICLPIYFSSIFRREIENEPHQSLVCVEWNNKVIHDQTRFNIYKNNLIRKKILS